MVRRLTAVLVCALWAGAAAACPDLHSPDKHLFLTARQLVAPRVAEVRAGGTVPLEYCETLPGAGNVPFEPSVAIYYVADRKRMDLEFRTEGDCDTVLLVRTPSGRWFFDDDNGGGRNARVRIGAPREGRYEVWVGSAAGYACPSRLAVQSFRAVTRYADVPALRTGPGRM
jgi:hypothetical protein